VVWLPGKDYFQFRLDDSFLDLPATKRNKLSVTARLFDPWPFVSSSDKGKIVVGGTLASKVRLRRVAPDATANILGSFQGNAVATAQNQGIAYHTDAKVPQKYMVSLTPPCEHMERASTFALIPLKA